MMDVEKQSNGSDCGVLAIAYAFDLCSGLNPCTVRFDHSTISCQVSRFPVLGERKGAVRKPKTVELHCSCRDEMAQCDVCHVWYHRHCMDIPSEVFGESEVHWECKRSVHSQRVVVLCTLLKVYLPVCSSHIVNHTQVCLHSRELLSFTMCLCVPK